MQRALEWLDVGCWTVETLKSVGYPGLARGIHMEL